MLAGSGSRCWFASVTFCSWGSGGRLEVLPGGGAVGTVVLGGAPVAVASVAPGLADAVVAPASPAVTGTAGAPPRLLAASDPTAATTTLATPAMALVRATSSARLRRPRRTTSSRSTLDAGSAATRAARQPFRSVLTAVLPRSRRRRPPRRHTRAPRARPSRCAPREARLFTVPTDRSNRAATSSMARSSA